VKHYCEWKGYLDQKEIMAAEEKYGKNKYSVNNFLLHCTLQSIFYIAENIVFF